MSKIESALNKARGERGVFPVPGQSESRKPTGTALVPERVDEVSTDAIARMNVSESRFLSAGELAQRGVIHPERVEDPAVQVFRELRTKIIQQSRGQNGVILVTALSQGSGSSFVAQNLGAAFAFDAGKTALVIDCNLKNPSLKRMIADPSTAGLTDYLEDPNLDVDKIIHSVGIARFRVIGAGNRCEIGAEYFTSLKMKRLIESLRGRYSERYIVLDGPPMSDIANIRILTELSDHVLVIARYGSATIAQIENSLNVIDDKKLVGIVFNDEPRIP
jgi:protein-tyrosine kinase